MALLLFLAAVAWLGFAIGTPIASSIGRAAEQMSGRYYTWSIFAGPAIQIAYATTAATGLGMSWAKGYRR